MMLSSASDPSISWLAPASTFHGATAVPDPSEIVRFVILSPARPGATITLTGCCIGRDAILDLAHPRAARAGRWLLPAALFLVLPVLAFPELFFGHQTLWRSDITLIHYPYHIMVADEWLAGRVPLWNPYQHIGIPLLAEGQVGPLYPLGVIFLGPLSPSLELSLFIVLHLTLAALFTFALARALGLATAPATLAGLAFGMGGFLMAQVGNLNIMTGAVWLPLVLCCAVLAARRRSPALALLGGVPLAFQAFTAQPQIVFYTLIILMGYAIYRVVADRHVRSAVVVGVLIVSGLLLSAPQLLPTAELQQHSLRSQERGFDFLTHNSWPPLMALNLLLPSAFGNNVIGFKGGDPFEEDFIYAGFIPLLLVGFAWGQRRRRDVLFFGLLLVGAAVLALGRHTPLYQLVIQHLPGFALFRIPSRWLMAVNLALAVLAGCGLQTLLERGLSRRGLAIVASVLGLLGIGLFAVWLLREPLRSWVDSGAGGLERKLALAFLERGFIIQPVYQTERLLVRYLSPLTAPAVLLAFNLCVALALLGAYAARRLAARRFAAVVLVAVALDLVVAGGTTVNPIRPDDWWQQLSGGARYVLDHLDSGRVWPLGMGSEAAAVRNLGQFFPSAYRIPSAGGHGSPLMLARQDAFLHTAHPVQQVRLLAVRYILTEGRMGADAESTFPPAFADDQSVVYENRDPLPRAYAVHSVVLAADAATALGHLTDLAIDPRRTVVIEAPADAAPPPGVAAGPDEVALVRDVPDEVVVQARLAADGYLVLLDTWYPGWEASVDGTPTPIYPAHSIARAVFVPGGAHTVRLVYRPLSFRVGVALAALTVMVTIAACSLRHCRRIMQRNSTLLGGRDAPLR
jgi:hypothetical protein